MAILGLLLAWPAIRGLRYLRRRSLRIWWLPAWLGILVLTLTQSFATTGYGPFLLGMLVIVFGTVPPLGTSTTRPLTHQ